MPDTAESLELEFQEEQNKKAQAKAKADAKLQSETSGVPRVAACLLALGVTCACMLFVQSQTPRFLPLEEVQQAGFRPAQGSPVQQEVKAEENSDDASEPPFQEVEAEENSDDASEPPFRWLGPSDFIPPQLILTGKFASLDELPLQTKQNLDNTLAHALGMKTRYLNDDACRDFLKEHFDNELVALYDNETHGSFRGDMCRSAVLLQEGGFYADLDFQFFMPLHKLIDEHTTFMTAYTAQGSGSPNVATAVVEKGYGGSVSIPPILNALIAVRPKSPIMERTMKAIKDWYAGSRQGLLGPMAMAKALAEIVRENCPEKSLEDCQEKLQANCGAQWTCGPESLRFYQEEYFGEDCEGEGQIVCPIERAQSFFGGSHFGVFSMGTQKREARLVGWSRYLGCEKNGCGINGGVASL